MLENANIAKWQRELMSFVGIKSLFIVEGNINDLYPNYTLQDGATELRDFCILTRIIANIFDSQETAGCYDFLCYDPLYGFSDSLSLNQTPELVALYERLAHTDSANIHSLNGRDKREAHSDNRLIRDSQTIRAALTQSGDIVPLEGKKSMAVIVHSASRFLASPEGMSSDEITFFLNLFYGANKAIRGNGRTINTLILIVEKVNDLPAWFYFNNPHVRLLSIPNPDRAIREAYIERRFRGFDGAQDSERLERLRQRFIDLTDGMKVAELDELRRLFDKSCKSVDEIADVVSIYKYGFSDNKWAQMRVKVGGNIKAKIEWRVKGQEQAVSQIVRVLKRAVIGLSGTQHSSDSKPRGILFLAGPTGTGKTEVVKSVAEVLFEDEKALIRFDMSEYTAEHADQKLFGAPPGYVGYDHGGQLTNAVRSNPFSILLFDEIEKAHPNIMDKFLQILEDGRMTDGQGNTVYFTETLIFFTSNVGISRELVDPATGRVVGRESIVKPGESYEHIRMQVEQAMRTYFKPEVINRIGENIVVFNFIDENASREILHAVIDRINENVKKHNKVEVKLTDEAYDHYFTLAWQDGPRANGGRGIGNVVEAYYLNLLAEFIFDQQCEPGDVIRVSVEAQCVLFEREAADV